MEIGDIGVIARSAATTRSKGFGRKLHGIARRAGFSQVAVQVLTRPDTEGRLMDMIRTVAQYACEGGAMDPHRTRAMLEQLDRGLVEGSYLAVAPQFLVTATR